MKIVDPERDLPLHQQLKQLLQQRIENQSIKRGGILPSETELCNIYNVSRITVRRALADLVNEGLLYRRQGKGTFVTQKAVSSAKKEQKTDYIGIIVVNFKKYFFSEIARGVGDIASRNGYKVILCNSDNRWEKEREFLRDLKDKVSGLIIAPSTGNQNHSFYGELIERKIPFIFVDRYLYEFNTSYVITDGKKGAYMIVEHLINLGHKRIAHITDPECTSVMGRLEGYKEAIDKHGISYDESLIRRKTLGKENEIPEFIKEFLQMEERPSAIFAVNDLTAREAIDAINKEGLNVPDDIAVVGFDDQDTASRPGVPLTTVSQDLYKEGKIAAEILFSEIKEKGLIKPQQIVLPVTLVVRKSCGEQMDKDTQ